MPDLGAVKLEVLSLIKEFCKLDENVLSYTPVLGLYLFPPIRFCLFSTVSSTDIFIFIPLHSYHHFIISNCATYRGQKLLFIKSLAPARTAIKLRCSVCASVCMTLIICVRLFEHVRPCVCLQHGALVPRDHTQIQEKRG